MATEKTIKITSCEMDENGYVRPSAIMRNFQQLSRDDLDQFGLTYDYLRSFGYIFVLTKSKFEIYEKIACNDELIYKTWPKQIHAATFERDFELFNGNKKIAAFTTQWVLIDFIKRNVLRPSVLDKAIPHDPNRSCGIEIQRRIKPIGTEEACGTREVFRSMLDENRHLNNCIYADIAIDYTDLVKVNAIQINFLEEARFGDILEISRIKVNDNMFYINGWNKTKSHACFEALISGE